MVHRIKAVQEQQLEITGSGEMLPGIFAAYGLKYRLCVIFVREK